MRSQLLVSSTIMFAILLFLHAQSRAKEQMIDLTVCVAGTCDILSEAQDWETESCESRGIGWSNNGYKPLETFSVFNKGLLAVKDKQWNMNLLTKYLDSEGDYLVIRNGEIFGGTGKWEGATGEIQSKWLRMAKSMPSHNFANCQVVTGTFELPE